MIPIMANYLFFSTLPEEAFMQECIRIEIDSSGDRIKKELSGVIYNEMKTRSPESCFVGGAYYKLHELTNEKIKEYYTKYYRPDNCLFVFRGKTFTEENGIEYKNVEEYLCELGE